MGGGTPQNYLPTTWNAGQSREQMRHLAGKQNKESQMIWKLRIKNFVKKIQGKKKNKQSNISENCNILYQNTGKTKSY